MGWRAFYGVTAHLRPTQLATFEEPNRLPAGIHHFFDVSYPVLLASTTTGTHMPRLTAPKRRGQPHALSGRAKVCNLDQLTFDRLHWAQHLTRRLLKSEAGASVLMRRAVAVYVAALERLLADPQADAVEREADALKGAARGSSGAIPEDALIAVPLRPFSAISADAREEARLAGMAKTKAQLDCFLRDMDNVARKRGHE